MAVRVQPRQLAFALPHAESLTRDNFLEGPANEAALALIEQLAGLAEPHHAAGADRRAPARAISPRSGPNRPARASISAHALTAAAVPGALATGALVVEDLEAGATSTNARCSTC